MNSIKLYIKILIGITFRTYCGITNFLNGKTFIFMYHRVYNGKYSPELYDPAMFVSSSSLKMHLKEFTKYFEICSFDDNSNDSDNNIPKCILTFDDGWADNYYYAFPLLSEAKLPATIFVTVNYIGTNKSFWFHDIWMIANECLDKEITNDFYAYFKKHINYTGKNVIDEFNVSNLISCFKELTPKSIEGIVNGAYKELHIQKSKEPIMLDWSQIEEMSRRGISIGSHGLNHHILTKIDDDHKLTEISDSMAILNNKLPNICSYFCYPNGNHDDQTIRIVKEAGYAGAIGTKMGFNTTKTSKYSLHRIAIHDDIAKTTGLLWFRIFQSFL